MYSFLHRPRTVWLTNLTPITSGWAKDGHAVGAMFVQSGNLVDGFRLIFQRIRGQSMNAKDSYESHYVGGKKGPNIQALGAGKPFVGISGNW